MRMGKAIPESYNEPTVRRMVPLSDLQGTPIDEFDEGALVQPYDPEEVPGGTYLKEDPYEENPEPPYERDMQQESYARQEELFDQILRLVAEHEALKQQWGQEDAAQQALIPTLANIQQQFPSGASYPRVGAVPAQPVQRPGQQMTTTPAKAPTFSQAFAAARAAAMSGKGPEVFTWTNPRTGKTGQYTTQLAQEPPRKKTGRR